MLFQALELKSVFSPKSGLYLFSTLIYGKIGLVWNKPLHNNLKAIPAEQCILGTNYTKKEQESKTKCPWGS